MDLELWVRSAGATWGYLYDAALVFATGVSRDTIAPSICICGEV